MLLMNVIVVADCPCDGHAWVHLLDSSGEHGTRVLIDAAVGRAITSELRGTPDTHAEAIDLLWSALHALGARLERVELSTSGDTLTGVLCLRGLNGSVCTDVDPCHAILAACRMKLPILMQEEAVATGTSIPPAFHSFLTTLDLDGLGNADGG